MPFPEIGKWRIAIRRQTNHHHPWKMSYEVGVYKLLQYPPEGEIITPFHYAGFRYTWDSQHSLEVQMVWNLPTVEEVKQRTLIWTMKIVRFFASLWANIVEHR
jgi:hypothetical protein